MRIINIFCSMMRALHTESKLEWNKQMGNVNIQFNQKFSVTFIKNCEMIQKDSFRLQEEDMKIGKGNGNGKRGHQDFIHCVKLKTPQKEKVKEFLLTVKVNDMYFTYPAKTLKNANHYN